MKRLSAVACLAVVLSTSVALADGKNDPKAQALADLASLNESIGESEVVHARFVALAEKMTAIAKASPDKAVQEQALKLQMQMQRDNREYTAVSNIMKTKHDTVKNAISNIR